MQKNRLAPLIAFFALIAAIPSAWSDDVYVQIPLKDNQAPAIDLAENGNWMGLQRATALRAELQAKGQDLSFVDPKPDDLWQPNPLPMTADPADFPVDGSTLNFGTTNLGDLDLENFQFVSDSSGFYRATVTDAQGRTFFLIIDLNNHRSLVTAALMRRLGYQVPAPQYYQKLKLKFRGLKEYENFMGHDSTGPEDPPAPGDVASKTAKSPARWVTKADAKNFEVELQDVNLEVARITVPQYYQGSIRPEWIQNHRAARAVITALSLLNFDLQMDSINIFKWEAGRIENQNILLEHPSANVFMGTGIDDSRWILRRMMNFDRAEWEKILHTARLPFDIEALLVEQVIARRNHDLQMHGLLGDLRPELKKLKFNRHLTIGKNHNPPGHVIRGEVVQENYPGYAARFTVGNPKAPLRWAELKHFVKIEVIAQIVNAVLAKANESLQFIDVKTGLVEHITELYTKAIEQIIKHPGEAYVVPVKVWSKPMWGLNASANRSIVTGTYYGSESKVQLVDNLAVGISYGRFGGLDGAAWAYDADTFNYKLLFQGNVGIVRNWTHVRPLPSLEATKKEKWTHLAVPFFMKSLGKILDSDIASKGDEKIKGALQEFLDELREGEVFTITDSATLRGGPTYTIPLTALMGPGLSSLAPSVGLGLTGEFLIMKRLMITRRNGNIEVYQSRLNTRGWSPNLDLNLWLNVAKATYQNKSGNALTDAMMIDLSGVLGDDLVEGEKGDGNSSGSVSPAPVGASSGNSSSKPPTEREELARRRKNFLKTLNSLFRHNDLDLVREHAPAWELKHQMNSKLLTGKALMWSWNSYSNRHRLQLTPPPQPKNAPENERYKNKDHIRTLYQVRKVDLQGKDPYGFFGQVVSRASKVAGVFGGSGSLNPSSTFMGKANWTSVKTEADITEKKIDDETDGDQFAPVVTIEDHYAGWNLRVANLLKILAEINREMRALTNRVSLFRKEAFGSTEKLQAYEIHSTALIFPEGVKRIDDLLLGRMTRQERLIRLMDLSETPDLRNRCREYLAKRDIESELTALETLPEDSKLWNSCVEPWMRRVIRWSRKAPSRDRHEEYIEWINRTVHFIQKKASLAKLLKRIGEDQFFFRVQVSGFRTSDEAGDETYVEDSIGSIPRDADVSPFNRLAVYNGKVKWTLLEYETNAQYLGGSGL